jgi:GMP synthase-like glutamine amidotransferase
MRRALLLQHMDSDSPGRFGDFLRADGFAIDAVPIHRGEVVPPLTSYDFMYVLGGPMDVWEEQKHPWLIDEKSAIREWVEKRAKPFLGVCLGHQLLAEALGGKVGLAAVEEVGVFDVSLNAGTPAHLIASDLPASAKVTQWHHAEIKTLPRHATVFASSATTAVQAMTVGDCALGLQFHAEWKTEFIASWSSLPSYVAAMEKVLGPGAHANFVVDAEAIMPAYHLFARKLYDNLMRMASLRIPA